MQPPYLLALIALWNIRAVTKPIDFLAVVSRPSFPSGDGPVGDYFNMRKFASDHPDWNVAVLELNSKRTEFEWDGRSTLISQPGEPDIDLSSVRTAFYVPICLEIEETLVSSLDQEGDWPRFEVEQWRPISAHIEHELSLAGCLNRPAAVRAANNKLVQYSTLKGAGFDLLPTVVRQGWPGDTSEPVLVAKNVSEGGWRSPTVFSPARLAGPGEGVEPWPVIWQRPVHNETELRVYVMGDEVSTVSLERSAETIDVRSTHGGKPVGELIDIRSEWSQMALAMTRALGLDYAVIDAIPEADSLRVLEVNANGVWWFLPDHIGTVLERRMHAWLASEVEQHQA
jgi:RimK-like ATP-grasp domain